MKKLLCLLACLGLVICLALPAAAGNKDVGQVLVNEFFGLIAAKDWKTLERHLAPCFQSAHADGARNRAQEMALLKKLNLKSYKLADFKTTRDGKIVVVSYTVSAAETIDGGRTNKRPAPRLTVFSYDNKTWQILAHANLKPLAK
jgi:hypothetical protein